MVSTNTAMEAEETGENLQLLTLLGFNFDEHGKYEFNPNVFATYYLEQARLLVFQENFFYRYQNGIWQPFTDRQILKTIRDFINNAKPNLYSSHMGNSALEILRLAAPDVKEMDANKNLVTLANGMLDLNNFEIIDHDPEYFSTVKVPITYDPAAICPKFQKFIHEIFEGDAERILVVQEITGYCLTAETKIHRAFFFHGDGANGKSVLLEVMTRLIGRENVSNLSLKDLENPFNRAVLIGKTVNISTENEVSNKGFNSQYLKAVVSGDSIAVERKYQNAISYSPICKLIFATNNLPYTRDCSYGFYRRLLVVPFNMRFTSETADVDLKNKLVTELPGILNWALAGLKRLREQQYKFSHSALMEEAFTQYKDQQNPMPDFIEEMLIQQSGERTRKADIVEAYYSWCARNGLSNNTRMSSQRFWAEFKVCFKEGGFAYNEQQSSGIRYLKNVFLKDQIV